MKIQYGIAGFAAGIMLGLLIGILEMKLLMRWQHDIFIPFVIGITVISCAVTGVAIGIKISKRL